MPLALDLSEYPKLKDIEFCAEHFSIRWIVTTLQTAKRRSPQWILIYAQGLDSDRMGEME